MLLVTTSQGAYSLRYWGPLAIFVLVALGVSGAARALPPLPRIAVGALWAFAIWSLLSATWADSPARALEGGARNLLYAGLFTLPLLTLPDRRLARRLSAALIVGVGVIVVLTFLAVLVDGERLYLAGRLNDPVGYRNGTAALFGLAFWPLLCLAAFRHANAVLRALAFAVAMMALGLAFMTQSRGVLIGFLIGGAVAIALGPDRVRRTWLGLVAVAGLAVAAESLLGPYRAYIDRVPITPELIEEAARALGILSLLSFAALGVIALLDGGLRLSTQTVRLARAVALGVLVLLTAGVLVAGTVAVGNPVDLVQSKAREFRDVDSVSRAGTRLGSTGGQRYDLWTVALREFRSAPVGGVGEGNYLFDYYVQRRTDRNLSTPHSLPLGILAENGLIGGVLFAGFLVAAALALAQGRRRIPDDTRRYASALAAAAAVVIAQSSVDFLWLIPGLAGLALLCLGLGLALSTAPEAPAALVRPPAWRRLLALGPLLAAALVALLFLSDYEIRKARAVAARSPSAQLDAARKAARFNPVALTPLYLEAGALEALGREDAARRRLRRGLEREPRNFVTLALLGDLETRAGNDAVAQGWYRQALELNPIDIGLQKLAAG